MIYIWFATPSEAFAREGAERVVKECEVLKRDPVPDDELAAMSNKLWNAYVDDFGNTPDVRRTSNVVLAQALYAF